LEKELKCAGVKITVGKFVLCELSAHAQERADFLVRNGGAAETLLCGHFLVIFVTEACDKAPGALGHVILLLETKMAPVAGAYIDLVLDVFFEALNSKLLIVYLWALKHEKRQVKRSILV